VRAWWNTLKDRYAALVEEYGKAALTTYLTLFFGTWFVSWIAIRTGMNTSSAIGGAGTVGGAYILTKATQPLRIGATLVITPALVGLWRRFRPVPEP